MMPSGEKVLSIAAGEIGTKESPPNSNNVKYNTWYYGRAVRGANYPWCMAFVQWCYERAGASLPYLTASCGALLSWYRSNQPECVTDDPQPGDVVIFDLPGGSDTDHTGIFERWQGGYIVTVDGNTGTTSDANGGAVMRRTRPRSYVRAYIHPRELEEEADMKRYNTMQEISEGASWAVSTIEKLIERKALTGSGLRDSKGRPADMNLSEDMLRAFVINDRMGLYG